MAALTDVHWDTITDEMRAQLRYIGRQPFAKRFYLAGGTNLALRIGHRISIDLDFFSETDEVHADTRREIMATLAPLEPTAVEDVDGDLLLRLPNLHLAFLSYDIHWLNRLTQSRESPSHPSLIWG